MLSTDQRKKMKSHKKTLLCRVLFLFQLQHCFLLSFHENCVPRNIPCGKRMMNKKKLPKHFHFIITFFPVDVEKKHTNYLPIQRFSCLVRDFISYLFGLCQSMYCMLVAYDFSGKMGN